MYHLGARMTLIRMGTRSLVRMLILCARACVSCGKHAVELGQSIWSEYILRKATEEVISIFDKEFEHSAGNDDE